MRSVKRTQPTSGVKERRSWMNSKRIVSSTEMYSFIYMFFCVVEHYLQTYTEPSNGIVLTASTSTSSIVANPNPSTSTTTQTLNTTNHTDQVLLPLTTGCLTTNFGIPIIVVCSKVTNINKSAFSLPFQ